MIREAKVAPASLRAWLLAARPKTLPAAVAPVVVGSAVAWSEGGLVLWAAVLALVVALSLQIAANLANDVFDYRRGADTAHRLGPPRVTQSGLISPGHVLTATAIVLGGAVLAGLPLVWRGGWPLLALGLLAIVAAVAYTAGPAPLGYIGLGEVAVFAFFGLVAVAGTAYVQTEHLTWLAVAAAIPVGWLVTAILVVNNLRDIETDRQAGKRTLAVRLGQRATRREYALLVGGAYLLLPLYWLGGVLSVWWWLPWLTLPLAVPLMRRVARESGPALNAALADTARLQLLFSVSFAGSILLR